MCLRFTLHRARCACRRCSRVSFYQIGDVCLPARLWFVSSILVSYVVFTNINSLVHKHGQEVLQDDLHAWFSDMDDMNRPLWRLKELWNFKKSELIRKVWKSFCLDNWCHLAQFGPLKQMPPKFEGQVTGMNWCFRIKVKIAFTK
jgi:hypothetical protein